VIATIHGVLIVVSSRFVEVDDELQIDGEVLKVGPEEFFEDLSACDAWVDVEEKTDDLGSIMSEVVGFNENLFCMEPIENGNVVDGGGFDVCNRFGAAENAADRNLSLEGRVIGSRVY